MHLREMLREQARAYVECRSPLAELRSWLADHVQEIADAHDTALDELDGRLWSLISEFDLGHRDEASIRAELSKALEGQPAVQQVGDTYILALTAGPRSASGSVVILGPAVGFPSVAVRTQLAMASA